MHPKVSHTVLEYLWLARHGFALELERANGSTTRLEHNVRFIGNINAMKFLLTDNLTEVNYRRFKQIHSTSLLAVTTAHYE